MESGPSRRNPLSRLAAALADRIFQHRRAVLTGWAVVTFALLVVASRLSVDGRLETLVPESDRELAEHVEAIRRLGASEMVYADVAAADPVVAARAAETVAARMQASGLFHEVFSRVSPDEIARTAALVRDAAPYYLEEADWAEIAARVAPAALAERVEVAVARLLEPGGATTEPGLRRDPLDLSSIALRRALGGAAAGPPVSADGRHFLVAAVASAPMGDEAAGEAIASLLDEIASDVAPGAEVVWVGGHRFYRANSAALREDIALVSTVGLLLVVVIVVLGYPGLRSALLAAAAGAMGGLAGLAVVVLVFGPVSGIALAFGGALAGISVDCVIHLRAVPIPGEARAAAVRRTYVAVAPSVAIGALTSVAAFLVLVASPVAVHRQIGVSGAAGIAGAALFALCAGPILAAGRETVVAAPERRARPARFEFVSRATWRAVLAAPRAWAVATALVLAASATVLPRIEFESDLRRYESKDGATLDAERRLSSTWGGLLSRSLLVVRADGIDAAITRTEDLLATLAPEQGDDAARRWTSAVSALPSRRTQDARWVAWTAFWTPARRDALRRDLADAAAPLGLASDAFEPFLESIDRRPAPPDLAALRRTALRAFVERHLIEGPDGVRSIVSLPADAPEIAGSTARRAAIDSLGVHVLSGRGLADAVVSATRSVMVWLALPAVLSVTLLLWAYYRDARRAVAAVVPLFGGTAIAAAGLHLCGERLSLMTLPVLLPTFGFAVDYGVFTLDAFDEAESDPANADHILAERGAGVLGAALTTASGGFAMLFAAHPAVRSIGVALVWCVMACVAVAWAALPGLLRWWGPRR